jgi:hypothetical protein
MDASASDGGLVVVEAAASREAAGEW